MPAPRKDALARFVLTPARTTNGKSLDEHWEDLARYMRGPGSALARWLAFGQMHSLYKAMKRHKAGDAARLGILTMRHFIERAMKATGVSRPTIYRYVERSEALVEKLGPATLKMMLSGNQTIVNDEDVLLKVAQLPPKSANQVVRLFMRGGRYEARASRLLERCLHGHRLAALTNGHEPQLRGGALGGDHAQRNVVLFGDALLRLGEIPSESVQVCVTSPPYWGLRDFGTRGWFGGDSNCRHDRSVTHGPFHAGQVEQTKWKTTKAAGHGQTALTHTCSRCGSWHGQLGLEPTPELYVEHMAEVFREVRRVLRPDGTLWLNIGDSYAAGTRGRNDEGAEDIARRAAAYGTGARKANAKGADGVSRKAPPGYKAKDLVGIPWMLAFALRADGWYLRSDIIWAKGSPMPEAVQDRPTRTHEHVFLLTKAPDYFYDHIAIMEPTTGNSIARGSGLGRKEAKPGSGNKGNTSFHMATTKLMAMRNCRDVWSFPAGRFPGAHTATFPPALPERSIRASTSDKGACKRCGAPWARKTIQGKAASVAPESIPPPETIGWEPTCECGVAETVPCIVLDPFAGSGTTLAVAKGLGRDYVGIEINEREYGPLIKQRLKETNAVAVKSKEDERPSGKRLAKNRVKAS